MIRFLGHIKIIFDMFFQAFTIKLLNLSIHMSDLLYFIYSSIIGTKDSF